MLTKPNMTPIEATNWRSHLWTEVDDCIRCMSCEIGIWNGHKENCNG